MKHLTTLCFMIIVCAWFAGHVVAQDFSITAEVDYAKVSIGEPVRYMVKITGTQQDIASPQLPEFKGFTLLQYLPASTQIYQSGTSIQIIKISGAILQPLAPGTFTIPPAQVTYEGKTYESNPVSIEVSKELPKTGIPQSLLDEGIISAITDDAELNKWLQGKLFLYAEVSTKEPYIGEPIVVTYYIYHDGVQIGSPKFVLPEPQYPDFIKVVLEEPQELRFQRIEVEQKRFEAARLRSIALIPTKVGEATLDPLKMVCTVAQPEHLRRRTSPRSMFDQRFDSFFDEPFFASPFDFNRQQAMMTSQPITVKIKPLPTPAPADFSGTVGNYTLKTTVDRLQAREDELLTLRIMFSGSGYVESIAEPTLGEVADFEVYSSKSKSTPGKLPGGIGGEKEFEFVLRPRRPGKLSVPGITYTLFNSTTGQYEVLKSEPIAVEITAVQNKQPLVVAGRQDMKNPPIVSTNEEKQVVTLGSDICYINTNKIDALRKSGFIYHKSLVLWLQLLPAFAVVIAFIISKRQERIAADHGFARRLYARGIASKRLKNAGLALQEVNADAFYNEISQALRGFIADKLNKSMAGLTIDNVVTELEAHSVDPEYYIAVREILERCDAARYASVRPTRDEMHDIYKQSERLIQILEKKLR